MSRVDQRTKALAFLEFCWRWRDYYEGRTVNSEGITTDLLHICNTRASGSESAACLTAAVDLGWVDFSSNTVTDEGQEVVYEMGWAKPDPEPIKDGYFTGALDRWLES